MTTTTLSRLMAAGRLAYGALLVLSPGRFARIWIGREAGRPATQVALRALGVRDAAIAAGVLAVSRDSDRLRPWIAGAAASDLVDGLATLGAPKGTLPANARWGTAVVAGGSALAGAAIYAALDAEGRAEQAGAPSDG